ncbi:hypothetical protein CR513_35070, partial [Mucuna pruriens]
MKRNYWCFTIFGKYPNYPAQSIKYVNSYLLLQSKTEQSNQILRYLYKALLLIIKALILTIDAPPPDMVSILALTLCFGPLRNNLL